MDSIIHKEPKEIMPDQDQVFEGADDEDVNDLNNGWLTPVFMSYVCKTTPHDS